MQVLVDTDAFAKLGSCGLLEKVLVSLAGDAAAARRLPALTHMLKRGSLAKRLGPNRCATLLVAAESMACADEGSIVWLDRLKAVAMDPGEAQLMAVAADTASALLLTGDKRALALVPQVAGLGVALAGRVVTIEAALLAVGGGMDGPSLAAAIRPAADLDTALSVFASTAEPHAAILAYQADNEKRAPAGVLWQPPPMSEAE